jgi:hypothetical protein
VNDIAVCIRGLQEGANRIGAKLRKHADQRISAGSRGIHIHRLRYAADAASSVGGSDECPQQQPEFRRFSPGHLAV